MRIFYTLTGMIADVVPDQFLPNYDTTRLTNPTLYIDIDEPANPDLCRDLGTWGILGKYSVDPTTTTLLEDDAWQPPSFYKSTAS